ncbi:MAG TPA: pirin family protein [Stellaceae bacterium]|nr:pirin family protein [Stellaceae bacterium]
MSWQPAQEPRAAPGVGTALEMVIVPRMRDIGGFEVRRVLPAGERRMVGPFIFFDQMGPVTLKAGSGIDVRPHPHIGLATVTYLFEGELQHRDSLGSVQAIRPGDINWMTAGRGIVHSERTPEALRMAPSRLFGIQVWVALPRAQEEVAPSFVHHGGETLPVLDGKGVKMRLMIGSLHGARSPVSTLSSMVYADVALAAGARLAVPAEHPERALYVVEGVLDVSGRSFGVSQLLLLRRGVEVTVTASESARLLILGGEPIDGPRHIWWNFVSSSSERIAQAKSDWKAGRFPPVPGETEFTPLPE